MPIWKGSIASSRDRAEQIVRRELEEYSSQATLKERNEAEEVHVLFGPHELVRRARNTRRPSRAAVLLLTALRHQRHNPFPATTLPEAGNILLSTTKRRPPDQQLSARGEEA